MMQSLASLDIQILQYLVAYRDVPTSLVFIGITELGSTLFALGFALCVALLFFLRGKARYALALAISVLGGGAAALLLKETFHRARPARMYQAYFETGYSFPSGHATFAAAFYGLLIYAAWRMMPPGHWRTAAIATLALLIALVSFSRLYLGVHFFSDVLGGLLLGGAFAYLGAAFVRKIERRGN